MARKTPVIWNRDRCNCMRMCQESRSQVSLRATGRAACVHQNPKWTFPTVVTSLGDLMTSPDCRRDGASAVDTHYILTDGAAACSREFKHARSLAHWPARASARTLGRKDSGRRRYDISMTVRQHSSNTQHRWRECPPSSSMSHATCPPQQIMQTPVLV